MSDDEVFVLIACAVIALVSWGRWYLRLATITSLGGGGRRGWLALAPPVWLAAVFALLRVGASHDVRDSPTYLAFYTVMGAAWLGIWRGPMALLDLRWRDDAIERRNPAALVVVIAALGGLAACYGGANIGEGPGWWCVLFAGALASVTWYLLWFLLWRGTGAAEAVSVERDMPTAIRFGGYLVASGLILGRGAAGDWTSAEQTLCEFMVAWPVLPLAGAAWAVELFCRRNGRAPRPISSTPDAVVIACAYVLFAIGALFLLPALPRNPAYYTPESG